MRVEIDSGENIVEALVELATAFLYASKADKPSVISQESSLALAHVLTNAADEIVSHQLANVLDGMPSPSQFKN